ncbi:MAG: sigma-54-dependent Fis family transcriptional regulator [Acidimicrobiia bacterium]|nr:sigma-54-dependent Fis family transcriptional regulator [Acidimicrobiia bacterium]
MTAETTRLLIVDDDPSVLAIVQRFARQLGFEAIVRPGGREALAALDEVKPDAILVDLQMPDMDGLDVLKAVHASNPGCKVILMTGAASIDSAVHAIKAGALDYLTKPFDFDRLSELLITVRESIRRRERWMRVDAEVAKQFEFYGMIGRSPLMQELFDSIRRLAPHSRTVLITGETGTGKELVAQALHKLGPRRTRRMSTLNCSAVVETLFESELFGHVRGAFTGATDNKVGLFEHADGGTLFLDEAGELPLPLQAKLLRAVEYGEVQRVGSLETRKVDVQVVAATNRDLRAEAAAGRFRSDLFYRLSIIEIHLPPLRERLEDIPYLVAKFTREFGERLNRPITGVSSTAERLLHDAAWPGNIRELRHVIERACILSDSRILSDRDISKAMAASSPTYAAARVPPAVRRESPLQAAARSPGDPNLLATAQREQIARVLRQVGGNKVAAARALGMSRRSLYRYLDRLQIDA